MLTITNKPVRKRSVTILSPAGIKEEDTSSDGGGGKFSLMNDLVYVEINEGIQQRNLIIETPTP